MSDSDTEIRKNPALQKILNHPALRRDPEEEGAPEAYEEARVRSRDSYMLEFRFANGRRTALSYMALPDIEFDPGEEGDTLTLRFGHARAIVNGQALGELYEKLLDQRAPFIQEGSEATEGLRKHDTPYVERIEIERKED